jgi:hypothetical protein
MDEILKIEPVTDGVRYIIKFYLESAKVAKYFEASCLMSVREISRLADLYTKGSVLYLDTPNDELTQNIGKRLKQTIETASVIP